MAFFIWEELFVPPKISFRARYRAPQVRSLRKKTNGAPLPRAAACVYTKRVPKFQFMAFSRDPSDDSYNSCACFVLPGDRRCGDSSASTRDLAAFLARSPR